MKKILCAAVAAVLAVGALTACGNKPSEPSGADAGKFTAECDSRRTGFVTVCAGGGSKPV